ncbi:MAG: hypothetical protein KDK33_07895 [Leptospiraceae bacterium]|nr:hypothetical protein [Leptospiraceae bacterium]
MITVLNTILVGILATLAMSAFMYSIHTSRLANADMVRALGSLVTRDKDSGLLAGLITHVVGGIMFAFPYCFVVSVFPESDLLTPLLIGGLAGFFHGFVFSFVMIALVAENHPIEQFRQAGVSVAVAHILGHIVYGLVAGALVYLLGIHYGVRLAIQ